MNNNMLKNSLEIENDNPEELKIETFLKNVLNEKNKNVRESILLSEITNPTRNKVTDINNSYYFHAMTDHHFASDDLNSNSMIISCMLKEFKLKFTHDKRKTIV
jgi:hypothetical protein